MAVLDTGNIVKAIYDNFNKRSFDETKKLLADNVQVTDVPSGQTLKGHEGYRNFEQGWITAFPDAKTEVVNVVASPDSAVVEFRGRGTHKGPLKAGTSEMAATGKKLDLAFCEVYVFKNGKISDVRLYYDAASMASQLGLKPSR